MSKVCCQCNKEKPFLDFNKNKRSKDGFSYQCKSCYKQNKKEYDRQRYLKGQGKNRLRRDEWLKLKSIQSQQKKFIIENNKKEKLDRYNQIIYQIKKLCSKGIGTRKIAKIIGINRSTVIKHIKKLNIDISNHSVPKKERPEEIKCLICSTIKSINLFAIDKKHYTLKKRYCLECKKIYGVKACERCISNNWNQFKIKEIINKKISRKKEYIKNWFKYKRNTDISFKLRHNISHVINSKLKSNLSSKNNQSILKYLPYNIKELKQHLENQFEPWMNWNNWGTYSKNTWKDEDSLTWTWQIDHIIPQSILPYHSMEDENFKKCWSLDNLRPLSSKQNIIDGTTKIRHKNIFK